jgi:hypothetical protein
VTDGDGAGDDMTAHVSKRLLAKEQAYHIGRWPLALFFTCVFMSLASPGLNAE